MVVISSKEIVLSVKCKLSPSIKVTGDVAPLNFPSHLDKIKAL